MRVYAAEGGANMGKTANHLDVARTFPSHFCTLVTMTMQEVNEVISISQFVAVIILRIVLSQGIVENAVMGGWSLGSNVAFHSTLQLEACTGGPRAVFALDARRLLPMDTSMRLALSNPRSENREFNRRQKTEFLNRISARLFVNIDFAAVPHSRFRTRSSHFKCPLQAHEVMFQGDGTVSARLAVFTEEGEAHLFPDTLHITIGPEFHWDIARRLRWIIVEKQGCELL